MFIAWLCPGHLHPLDVRCSHEGYVKFTCKGSRWGYNGGTSPDVMLPEGFI